MGVVLLGYRGSGKSTVGRLLANRLQLPLIDTDQRVVALAKMSIREIFEADGESKFRELESTAVAEACEQNAIVSLGGGAILLEQNRERLIKSKHHRIYLCCDARVLHDRIHGDPATAATRPSLTHLGGSLAEIETLLAKRDPIYRKVMTHMVDVDHLLPESVADAIVEMIQP